MRNLMKELNSNEIVELRQRCYDMTGEWIPFNWDEFGSVEVYKEYLKMVIAEFNPK